MSEPLEETAAAAATLVCEDCGQEFTRPQTLAMHRKHRHPETPPPLFEAQEKPKRKRQRRVTSGSLKTQIRDAMLGTAAVVAIKDPRIFVAVEATVDEFAQAWDNVARQSPAARRYIEGVLNGGVWIGAIMATVVMAVTVAAVTDSLPPALHPLGYFCLGRAGIEVQPVPAASMNGGASVGAQSTADQ